MSDHSCSACHRFDKPRRTHHNLNASQFQERLVASHARALPSRQNKAADLVN
jgi:hypothetical protein